MIIVQQPTVDATVVGPPRVESGPATTPLSWSWSAPWLDRTWGLTDLSSPVIKLKGATGTGQADFNHWWSEAPNIDGATWDGGRTGSGSVFLPLMVWGRDSVDFLTHHRAFMQSLDPRREGALRVTLADGTWREVNCRYATGADMAIDLDPVAACRATYGITWVTADPFWRGEPVIRRFANDSTGEFFPGPPWKLATGLSLSDASVVNPGDVGAYPVWRIEAPFTEFSVGIGSSLFSMKLTKATGWVEADMRPGKKTILDEAGLDVRTSVTEWNAAAIPPGGVDLEVGVAGSGPASAVSVWFTPRYRRAW